ncbi:MAG: cytochrome C biogenesis protein [Sedimenticola sp.]|nr:MAG: cytochrome C biogenesis protein [Sedimenticola sp.]
MQYKDYYKILGVKRDASAEEIKRAYRRLAHKYHPDVSKEANAEARFKEINEAGEVLRDQEKRAAYDQLGANWRAGQDFRPPPGAQGSGSRFSHDFEGANLGGFSDFFESLFGHEFRAGGAQGFQSPGSDQSAKLIISLEDAYHGASRTIQLDIPEPDHHGGVVNKRRQLKVRIPAGISEGQKIRLAGQWLPGLGSGPKGDLYLEIEFMPHPFYQAQGKDIYIDLPISPWEAALGGSVSAPTLAGPVSLKVPPGTQSGKKMRLKGRGLPGKPAGDQYVIFQIRIPQASNPRIEAIYKQLQQESPFNPRAELGV